MVGLCHLPYPGRLAFLDMATLNRISRGRFDICHGETRHRVRHPHPRLSYGTRQASASFRATQLEEVHEMKRILTLAILLGSFLLVGIHAAHATCISPFDAAGTALPRNDVSVDAFAFEAASLSLGAFEVDMNGVQPGLGDSRLWATHGTLVVLVNPTGEIELVASWTQNERADSVEWVCRLKPDPTGGPLWFGDGFHHSTVFGTANFIARCTLDLIADC